MPKPLFISTILLCATVSQWGRQLYLCAMASVHILKIAGKGTLHYGVLSTLLIYQLTA